MKKFLSVILSFVMLVGVLSQAGLITNVGILEVDAARLSSPAYITFNPNGGTGGPGSLTWYEDVLTINDIPVLNSQGKVTGIPKKFPQTFFGWAEQSNAWMPSLWASGSNSVWLYSGERRTLYATWVPQTPYEDAGYSAFYADMLYYPYAEWYAGFTPPESGLYSFKFEKDTEQTAGYVWMRLYNESETLLKEEVQELGEELTYSYYLEKNKKYYVSLAASVVEEYFFTNLYINREYTITYNANGGYGGPDSQPKLYNEPITITDNTPENSLRPFLGWATTPDAYEPEYYPGDEYEVDGDATLYAVWGNPSGMCGEDLRWEIGFFDYGEKTLRFSGSGKMYDYSLENRPPWYDMRDDIKKIDIGYYDAQNVTIGDYAFADCYNLTYLYLGSNIVGMGEHVFANCTSLESADLEYVEYKDVPSYTFYGCSKLNNINLPRAYENIGAYAFYGCSSIYNVEMSFNVKSIGEYAFANCKNLWYFRTDEDITVIEPYTFYNCSNLTAIDFYSDVEKISEYAFAGCSLLEDVTLPKTVTTVEKGAFANCTNLKTVTVPDSVTEIGTGIFAGVKDYVTMKCYTGTKAYQYALDNSIKYELIPWGVLESPTFTKSPIAGGMAITMIAPEGTIYYTTDGSIPTKESKIYTSPIMARKNMTIKAFVAKEGWIDSDVYEFYTDIERTSTPFANIESGIRVTKGTKIELYSKTEGAEIRYTTDMTVPTEEDVYSGAFEITEDTLVYAYAVSYGKLNSLLAYFEYDISSAEDTPEVTTLDATDITETSARVFAEIDDKNGVLYDVQFVYYEKNNSNAKYVVKADENNSAVLTGLTPDTEYWYQARAINELGWSYGFVKTFKTDAQGVMKPTSIELTPGYFSCKIGDKRTLLAKILPLEVDTREIYWSSENTSVATVDQNGVVTAVGLGNTRIKATTISNRLVATCRVDVMSNKIVGDFNFSEHNMITNSSSYDEYGFDHGPSDGGNALMSSAYLARWDGAVLEEYDPYPDNLDGVAHKEVDENYHVQEILYIPYRNGDLDNDEIKNAIMKYGAVYTSFKVGYEYDSQNRMRYKYFDDTQTTYYFPKNAPEIHMGHAIVIVGWDDNYSRANFDVIPPGNGAFICKNSWGEGSGEGGYFYVSYYDKYIARATCGDYNAVFLTAESKDNYNKIYQYDYLGPVGAQDFGLKTLYSANVFPAQGEMLQNPEGLSAVSFYSYAPGEAYEIYVVPDYKDMNSLTKLGSPVKTGTSDYAGYHTIKLDEVIELQKGTRFAVIVKQTAMNGTAKVFVEMPTYISNGISHSSKAKANKGESFVGMDSKMWMDLTDYLSNANFCIKAFTKTSDSGITLHGIDNIGREYEDDTVHSLADLKEKGFIFNDEFVNHYEKNDELTLMELATESIFGFAPPSIIPDLATNHYYSAGVALPARYDLRSENAMTSVKNQGDIGSCWSFATYASLESAIKKASNNSSSVSSDGLNMTYAAASSISLDITGAIMALGNKLQINATAIPYDSTDEIIWSSSDESVASVTAYGYVTAVGTGNAYITASTADGTVSAKCAVTVTVPTDVTSIVINNTESSLKAGEILMIDYSIYPQNAGDRNIIWEVSDTDIAEINEYGILKAKAAGVVTVTAYSSDKTISGQYTLEVTDDFNCRLEIVENTLRADGADVYGNVVAKVVNKSADLISAKVYLGIYDNCGRLLKVVISDETEFLSGENTVEFNGIRITSGAGEEYNIKLLLWNNEQNIMPLAAAKTR